MERSLRFRPPLRRLCSSTASERCFASADFLLMVLDDVYEHSGRRGRALDAPQVNGGALAALAVRFLSALCVSQHARVGVLGACAMPVRMLLAVRMRSCAPEQCATMKMLCEDISATCERTCSAPVYWRASVHVTCDLSKRLYFFVYSVFPLQL